MRSPRLTLKESILRMGASDERYIDVASQLCLYHRGPDGRPQRVRLLPEVWGGRWDTWGCQYVGPAHHNVELSCHQGQLELLTTREPGISRVLALGPPGGGKSDAGVRVALREALLIPGGNHGLMAPSHERTVILWDKLLDLLTPTNWIVDIQKQARIIQIVNGSRFFFFSSRRQEKNKGHSVAGYDMHSFFIDEEQDCEDSTISEVDKRGRVSDTYCVIGTATNEKRPEFITRKQVLTEAPWAKVIRFGMPDLNPWYRLEHLEAQRHKMSDEEWRRIMELQDTVLDNAVYPAFDIRENLSPLPEVGRDVTAELVRTKFDPNGMGYPFIACSDFGTLTTVTHMLKAFNVKGERYWWVTDEIVSKSKTADKHIGEVLRKYPSINGRNQFLDISMPHVNAGQKGQTELHDFHQVKKRGVRIVRASGKRISRKHRYSMVNALLHAADGKRRLFVACDQYKRPMAPKLVESFQCLEYGVDGNPEDFNKGLRDLTHYTDTIGYGLFPWEKFRGRGEVSVLGVGGLASQIGSP